MIAIGDGRPSEYAVWTNAHALARYAALAQEAGLVPIVEPEVLMDGTHTLDESFHVTSRVLHAVFTELHDQRVQPEGMLLKPNMVLPGYDCPVQASDEEIAELTLRCLRRHVPAAVPGIVFLSGGRGRRASDRETERQGSTAVGPSRGDSRSRSGGRSRTRSCRPGAACRATWRPRRGRCSTFAEANGAATSRMHESGVGPETLWEQKSGARSELLAESGFDPGLTGRRYRLLSSDPVGLRTRWIRHSAPVGLRTRRG